MSIVSSFLIGMSVVMESMLSDYFQRIVKQILEKIAHLNPKIHITKRYSLIKVKKYYILSNWVRFYRIIFMTEKIPIEVSKFRGKYFQPKTPRMWKGITVNKFLDFNIKKSTGTAIIYDVIDKQWYKGEAVQFSLSHINPIFEHLKKGRILRAIMILLGNLFRNPFSINNFNPASIADGILPVIESLYDNIG
ncbi:MAG: hypothetical protein ACTSUI_00975 [Promethearchaeota archaeon]